MNLVEQLNMLKQNDMYDEALKLANLIDEAHFDALRKKKTIILSKLHKDYAFYLFKIVTI